MKHPVRDRILIFISVALLLAAAAALVLMTLGFIPMELLKGVVAFMWGNLLQKIIVWTVALVLAIFAILLLGVILPGRSKRKKPFATINGENGAVNISVKALENLVQKCLQAHPELSVVSSTIFSDGDCVRITLHITLLEDISIPLAVSALQKEIRQYVQSCAGVEIDDVRVFVDGTTANEKESVASPYRVASAASIAQPLSEKSAPAADEASKAQEEPVPVEENSAEASFVESKPEAAAIEPEEAKEESAQDEENAGQEQSAAQL